MLRKSYSLQSLHTKYPSLFDFTMQKGLFLGSLRLRINLVSPEAKKIDAVAPAPAKSHSSSSNLWNLLQPRIQILIISVLAGIL